MHVPQLVAIGAALIATSASAAPLAGGSGQGQPLSPLSYRATGAGAVGGIAPQAFFASPRNERRAARTLSKRKPSLALEAVINYVRRFTAVPDEEEEEGEEEEEDGDESDGSDASGFYPSIGREKVQKPFGVPGKRANAVCGAKTTATTSASKTASTSAKPTSSTAKASSIKTTAAATSASTKAAAASSTASVKGKGGAGIVTGYWPSWASGTLPPEKIAWSKFDYVFYAFAVPTSSGSITIDDASMLKRFVKAAHAGNTKAILSLGGWGQSNGFSNSVSSDSARSKFITNVLKVISTYNLDGVDFDWEYPGNVQGGTSNPKDTGNFQTFLQQLRAKIPSGKLMTAAVPQEVWQASNGKPVGSVARAGGALDHIVLMNYDVWGSSGTPGPNAPLGNLCGNSTQPVASAAGGVKAWTAAGFPRAKILLGVPAYGYINTSSKRRLVQRNMANAEQQMDQRSEGVTLRPDRPTGETLERRAALKSMDGTTGSGQINFNSLVSQGALVLNSQTGQFDAGSGYTKYWDDCSDTPYLANGKTVVTYDDPDSLYDKGDFARLAGISGIAMWSIDGDMTNNVLINSLQAGLKGS